MTPPKYIPIPRYGTKCPYSGLCRSTIYNLISGTKANGHLPLVDSITVRLPGRKRGARRVCYDSLMRYLQSTMVSAEQLRLRHRWRAFRATQRGDATATITALRLADYEDFPEDPAVTEHGIRREGGTAPTQATAPKNATPGWR